MSIYAIMIVPINKDPRNLLEVWDTSKISLQNHCSFSNDALLQTAKYETMVKMVKSGT